MTSHFGDRLCAAVQAKGAPVVIGIDPRLENLPPSLARLLPAPGDGGAGKDGVAEALLRFGIGIVDAVADIAVAIKPNIAFFEAHGLNGLVAYNSICRYARSSGLLVIGDIKRADIGSTAVAYARAHLGGGFGPHDALTVNPYLGRDALLPFLEAYPDSGLFVLVKTSNPSSVELQDLQLSGGETTAMAVARLVHDLARERVGASGLSTVGAVVGATHPDELCRFRQLMPSSPFLVPGYGAQGGTAADVVGAFRSDGGGVLVNASRSVIFAWQTEDAADDWAGAARRAAQRMHDELLAVTPKPETEGRG